MNDKDKKLLSSIIQKHYFNAREELREFGFEPKFAWKLEIQEDDKFVFDINGRFNPI